MIIATENRCEHITVPRRTLASCWMSSVLGASSLTPSPAATLNKQGLRPRRGRWMAHALHLAMRRHRHAHPAAALRRRYVSLCEAGRRGASCHSALAAAWPPEWKQWSRERSMRAASRHLAMAGRGPPVPSRACWQPRLVVVANGLSRGHCEARPRRRELRTPTGTVRRRGAAIGRGVIPRSRDERDVVWPRPDGELAEEEARRRGEDIKTISVKLQACAEWATLHNCAILKVCVRVSHESPLFAGDGEVQSRTA